ncbi:hypothetical protein FFLO_06549 [Filobasidium floriforme]|uniref:GST N-terminal domain-containing protein n=1 Tax=Filobasidium floriforme TaxID=5210 RepID=A0A8K0JH20_9TREE|nr:hypothetical protein FFLO_06549 [Filobasidium floriforme]
MSSARIVLYSSAKCPFAHRTRIALKVAGASYDLSEIDLRSKPKWYTENVNTAGKVPALSYGAPADSSVEDPPKDVVVLPESGVIVDFVASLFPIIDYTDVVKRAQANLAAVQYEALVAPHWGKLQWGGGSPEALEAVLKGLGEWTATYLPEFMVSGEEFGVGDIKLGPFVTRLFLFSEHDVGVWPEGTGDKITQALQGEEFADLRQYAKRLGEWSDLKNTVNEDDVVDALGKMMKGMWAARQAPKQ